MHWSYWTQILTAEPSLQTNDWFSDRSRVCLGLRHSCPDFSWGCHYCVLWDLIWRVDLWASLFNDAGMCFPQRKVPFTFHVVSLIMVRSAESRNKLGICLSVLIPGWTWAPVICEAHPSLYSQIIAVCYAAVFWSFPFPPRVLCLCFQ